MTCSPAAVAHSESPPLAFCGCFATLGHNRMSKQKRSTAKLAGAHPKKSRAIPVAVAFASVALLAMAGFWILHRAERQPTYVPRSKGSITYNKDIAPIVHQHCLNCHRPGESAHLDLV